MWLNRQRGFTLIELLVCLAVGGLVAAFMTATLVRQQRFYSSASAALDTRAQLRDAADVLGTDIRSAAIGLGVPVMRDTAIELFTVIASSVVCTTASATSFGLPPLVLASGHTLTSMLALPDTGDLALVYTMPPAAPDSGSWETRRTMGFVPKEVSLACPQSTGFTAPADAASGHPAYHATIELPTVDPARAGAPIHFVRRARYSIYRSSDNRWYLGYRRCNAKGPSACAAIQPVSGPYYASSAGSFGITFRYFDHDGVELPSGSSSDGLARVDFVVRGKSARNLDLAGDARSTFRDSVIMSVSPRNRFR